MYRLVRSVVLNETRREASNMFNKIFVISLCMLYTNAGPVDVQKCKGNDSDCIKAAAIKIAPAFIRGIPEIGLKTMEPLKIELIDASTDGLRFKIKDVDVTGFNNCKFNRVARDLQKSKIYVDLLCNAHVEGQYDIDGNVLVIPIKGNGKITVDLKKLELNINADIVLKKGKDGKQHWSIKKWNYNYDLQDKSHLEFENLFPGNDVLRQATREVISQSSNDVIKDIGGPVIKSIIGKVVEHVNKFFKGIPEEDLALS